MKSISLIFLITCFVFSMDDFTVSNIFIDSSIIEADDFNENFEEIRDWIEKTNDSIDQKFVRFSDVKDSNFQKINCDTIRSNPDVDTIRGRPWIDSVKTTHIESNQVDINGGSIDGVIIGESSRQDANFDSVNLRIITDEDDRPIMDTGSFPCTLSIREGRYYGTTTDTIGIGHYIRSFNMVSVYFDNIIIYNDTDCVVEIKNYPLGILPSIDPIQVYYVLISSGNRNIEMAFNNYGDYGAYLRCRIIDPGIYSFVGTYFVNYFFRW